LGLSTIVIGSKAVCNARILKLMPSFEACESGMPVQYWNNPGDHKTKRLHISKLLLLKSYMKAGVLRTYFIFTPVVHRA